MRIIVSQSKPRRSPTLNIPCRPRSGPRRRRNCFRFWKNGLVRNKVVVKGSQSEKWKGKRTYEVKLEVGNVTYVNKEGVDLELLARVGDGAYEMELERMTKGMSRVKLVGFMESLAGNWCGRSDRRKLVAAADIVKVLPEDWNIEIAIRCRAGLSSLYCRNYVSPTGRQFKSCKDVAGYLKDRSLIDVPGPSKQGEMRQINIGSSMLLNPINEVTRSSTFLEANNKLLLVTNDLYDVEIHSHIDCPPCRLTFDDIDSLNKHLAICHKKTTRIFDLSKKPNTLDKAQTDCGQNVVVGHDERLLGEPSSSSQRTAGRELPVININNDGTFMTECIWCYQQFLSKPVDAESMADGSGFMCPPCIEIVWGRAEKSLSRCKMH